MLDDVEDPEVGPRSGAVETRAGYVALIGMPNAGKSTLLNRLIGTKLSIVTSWAQTTRERVVGIETRGDVQMIFLDTPGIVTPAYLLHHSMLGIVQQALDDADVVALVLDGTAPPPQFAPEVLESLRARGRGLVPIVNKVDAASGHALGLLDTWAREQFGTIALRVSAETGTGMDQLWNEIAERLPVSPLLFPGDELSTQPVRFFAEELVRETVFELYSEEIPYSVAVKIDEFREAEEPIFIRAAIFVERPSQKGILIGRGGTAIRELGTRAREKIEGFVGARVYLDLWVKVLPRWRKKPLELERLGFPIFDRDA